jgi:16S rRNA (adenine1518-N6/adenine1519-N6)-dimethyltransferase
MTRSSPRPRKRFGQHFLEPAWVRKVVAAADPKPGDQFLEIGPGRGALTLALAPRVRRIVGVEIDRDLAASLAAAAPSHVRIVPGDFLDLDVASLIATEFDAGAAPTRVIGNLPYNASSPILFRIMASADLFADATLMLQREVADRLLANVGTGDYGVLSVLVAVHADVVRLLDLPPGAFRPPPKVRSTVIGLRFHPPVVPRERLPRFEHLVRGIFQHRRKTIANALRGAFPDLDPSRLSGHLAEAGLDGRRRPETLEVAELSRLARLIGE